MAEELYRAQSCAFHPKEQIFNFCKNAECLLPLCPSCVKVHSEEHKEEKTYGKFENMGKVVSDLDAFFAQTVKELNCCSQDIKDHASLRDRDQDDVRKRIADAKHKMLTVVERFFTDFEKEVTKSMLCFNESIKDSYAKLEDHIDQLRKEVEEKNKCLPGDKVLKTVIGFFAKAEEQKYLTEIEKVQEKLTLFLEQKVEVVCQSTKVQDVIDQLGNYIHLSFQNWEHDIKYVNDFIKTGFTEGPFQSKTVRT